MHVLLTFLSLTLPIFVKAQYGFGPAGSASTSDELAGAGYIFEYSIIGLAIETFFFGIFAVLIMFSTSILMRKGLQSNANCGMLITTLLMFGASACYWAISLAILIQSVREILITHDDQPIDDRLTMANTIASHLYLAEVYLPMVTFVLGDAMVVWRAYVLWPPGNKWRFFVLPVTLLVGSVVTALLVGGWKVKAFHADSDALELELNDTQIVSWSLSLGTNFIATVLISWQAWKQRKFLRNYLGHSKRRTQVERIFSLLVESGILYCLTQIVLVVTWFVPLPNTTAWASDLIGAAAVQLSGIYPTVIVVLVSLQRSLMEATQLSTDSSDSDSGGVFSSGAIGTHLTFAAPPISTAISTSYSEQEENVLKDLEK
ncbi:hypothetical protein BDP27DRAFT_1209574 [Rhodocollybia butyracea]|uniref:Uncharacterized protein n=1 Tax=Rhodocollybia butyracea TaxID=206335 RepID=A0A9P5Q8U8_9AGAR|nr:hypothetical protein BDP27DRAFT_1209574 [Rhodocollybia butyracea]